MKKIIFILSLLILSHFIFIKITQWHFPQSLIQKPVLIQGVIDSVPEKKFHGAQFNFSVTAFDHQKIATHFLISWYQHLPALQIGQRWQLTVKLKPPIGSHNPGGFDYVQFLESKNILATGYVVARSDNKLLNQDNTYFIDIFRKKVEKEITDAVQNPAVAAFISALCVGLRDGLSESDWQVFQKTGTNHLVAIAGLHIGFVAMIFYFFAKQGIRLFPRLLLIIPASRFADMISLIAVLIYSALSGFAIPAQRACIMLCFFMCAQLLYRQVGMSYRLLFSALFILMLNPFDFIDASFWLSFSSIAFLTWVMSGRMRSEKHLKSWGKMQMALVIGLLPLMLWYFQQASIIAFFTNLIAIPCVGFLILPMSLIATIFFACHFYFLSHHLFWLTGKLLLILWQFLAFSAQLSFASWHYAIANKIILMLAMIGSIFVLAPRGLPARWLGCFGLLPLFFYHPAQPKMGDFWVSVIDVGQGLSVLVQTAHHVMLYDAGAHIPGGFDVGESVVAPYLRTRGISRIDRLEISHGDNDHSGGADAIVRDFHVKSIFTSAPNLIAHFNAQACAAGQEWTWDDIHFTTLNPAPNAPYADNNSSCVIKIAGKGGQMLLTGDIEAPTESVLVQQYAAQLHASVMLVPHHGSNTSSSEQFITAVSAHYAIISAGRYNRYHLPSASIISRYLQHDVKVYVTADNGAIIIRFLQQGQVRLSSYFTTENNYEKFEHQPSNL